MAPREDDAPEVFDPGAGSTDASRPSRRRAGGARSAPDADRAGVLAALEAGIGEALPGIEILDRDLRFDDAGRADLVAVDPLGRLLLVLVADEDPERAALDALDLVAVLRRDALLLVQHLASRRVDPGLEPRVVVVDPSADERLAERLAALEPAGVALFAVRTLRSAAGERSYLVRTGTEAGEGPRDLEGFLEALPLPLQDVGRELAGRMARLDEDLSVAADGRTLVWRFRGRVLARLEHSGERLTASVAPHRRRAAIQRTADVDDLLEEALARLLVELERGEEERAGPGGPPGLLAPPIGGDEPLLTAEEIEAFRD